MIGDHPDDVALGDRSVESEQQIGRRQVEEVQRVRLEHLSVMHQPAHLFGRRSQRLGADDPVHRLGGTEMVTYRTDAAEPLHQHR